jgi:hypothetical protein
MHGAEVARANKAHINLGLLGHWQNGPALNTEGLVRTAVATERKGVDGSGSLDPGNGANILEDVIEEINFGCGCGKPVITDG